MSNVSNTLSQVSSPSRPPNQWAVNSASVNALKLQLDIANDLPDPVSISLSDRDDVTSLSKPYTSASLLRRAKTAERKLELLMKQLSNVTSVPQSGLVNENDTGNTDRNVMLQSQSVSQIQSQSQQIRGGGGVEIRRLQRKVKDLETKLVLASKSQGGHDLEGQKSVVAVEKQFQKKVKEMETAFQKEKKALEIRAKKAEIMLETSASTLPILTNERDSLRTTVLELTEQVRELSTLREVAGRAAELDKQLQESNSAMLALEQQFKKETALRKKYKNELEDLKGTIRVYARCRPMAKYEIERGCNQAVTFVDESCLKVVSGRGEKAYEFDSVFGPGSTQAQVFEDTRRLVESCLDGFNVCLFAYGQTGSGQYNFLYFLQNYLILKLIKFYR
jgi:hypothetical protein